MPKQKTYKVKTKKENPYFVGTIKTGKIKVRKGFAPPTEWHSSKKTYRRKPKHPGTSEE